VSKKTPKVTFMETAQAWIAKHGAEGLDLKALNAAVASVEKKTAEARAAATQLGEILEARKAALKALKETLKAAKATRKAPAAPVPKKVAPKKAPSPKPATPS